MLTRTILAAGLVCVALSGAQAQTLSPAEIRAMVDERVSGLNEYQKLLNDPDPARSVAAMQIMMASGDPDLERMALDYGLYSSSPVVRRAALEAFFNSAPTLELWVDGSQLEDSDLKGFENNILHVKGSIASGSRAFFNMKVGDYDEKNSCWTAHDSKDCLLRLTESSVSIVFFDKWQNLALNDEGVLVGEVNTWNVSKPLPASIEVTR